MTNTVDYLLSLDACKPAVTWAEAHGGTLAELWRDCQRGEWSLWFAARVGVDPRLLAMAKAACARMAIPYCRDEKVTAACEAVLATVRRWARGNATDEELSEARRTAAAAKAKAKGAAAIAAASAAAADTADDADDAAYFAAYAATADVDAADAADDARIEMQRRTADAVRAVIPWSVVAAACGLEDVTP